MAYAEQSPRLRGGINPDASALAFEWRRLTRAATAVALLTAPAFFLVLYDSNHLSLAASIIITVLAVVVFRGLVEVIARKLIPWPSLFGAYGRHGTLAAIAMLYSDGVVAQVEDVYTVPEERRRGYARALVTKATEVARAAGHELVFIVADADDWPQRLYRRIGFVHPVRAVPVHGGPGSPQLRAG